MKSAVGSRYASILLKFSYALEYNADSEVCMMCSLTIIARFHMEQVTSNMHIMRF